MSIKKHPIYDDYEFNATNGKFRQVGKIEWLCGHIDSRGYNKCNIKGKLDKKQKAISVHRAIWETFKGEIGEGQEIDHMDNDKNNNKLENLQCITKNENRKRRNHDFIKDIASNAHKLKRKIKGINIETNSSNIFETKTQCAKYYGCSPALVYLICEGKNKAKTFGGNIKFEYTDNDPDTFTKEKPGKKKLTDEERIKRKKEANNKAMKKYYHKKKLEKIGK